MQSPQKQEWLTAMQQEMKSLDLNNTWTLVQRPKNTNILTGRWIFSIKTNNSDILKFKARFCARGYTQNEGIEYLETYAPTAHLTSIRIIINIAVQQNLIVHQCDVDCAYLNSNVDFDIFMEQPEGFVKDKNMVCLLNKSLYGLKQSGHLWNNTLIDFMNSQGLKQTLSDQCVFVRIDDLGSLYVLIWVDDLLIAASSAAILNDFKYKFSKKFKIKDLGPVSWFLGMCYKIHKNCITINQKVYTEKILARFNMTDCKPRSIPCDPSIYALLREPSEPLQNVTKFRELIGSLMYLMTGTRPDICYVVTLLSRFMNSPLKIHMTLALGILRYLKYSLNYELSFNKSVNNLRLFGYADSDHASDLDFKSISGYVFKLNPISAVISWRSAKQNLVAVSSCEFEYIALHEATNEALFFRQLISELTYKPPITVTIYGDNQGAISLAKHACYHRRTKHIDLKFHAIRAYVANKSILLRYIQTNENIADMFTKAVVGSKLRSFETIRGVVRKGHRN